MRRASRLGLAVLLPLCCLLGAASGDELVVPLPAGVAAVWDIGQAFREGNAKRERICLNGLWRWQPASIEPDDPPRGNWGYFKVPGCWPGITDYMQKDCQAVVAHPTWQGERLGGVGAAWYEREITVPAAWNGRRITLSLQYLNSLAVVHLDGKRVGDLRFPGGELDITSYCRAGKSHRISVHVAAVPLQGVLLSYSDSNAAREVQGRVRRRGLCGDVFLVSRPIVERITEVAVTTSVRDGEVRFESELAGLRDEARYTLRARVTQANNEEIEFIGPVFEANELDGGRFSFNAQWLPERLWDIHTPGHM